MGFTGVLQGLIWRPEMTFKLKYFIKLAHANLDWMIIQAKLENVKRSNKIYIILSEVPFKKHFKFSIVLKLCHIKSYFRQYTLNRVSKWLM